MEKDQATTGANVNPEGQDSQAENTTAETYTQEELDAKVQAEADRRVSQALETAKAKWQKEQEELIAKEKDEAAKLAKMTEAERAKAQIEKDRKALEEERAEFQRSRLELETVKQLADKDLPTDFAVFLMGSDAEETAENLKTFKEAFDKAVEEAVKVRLSGRGPKANQTEVAKKSFNMAEYADKTRII